MVFSGRRCPSPVGPDMWAAAAHRCHDGLHCGTRRMGPRRRNGTQQADPSGARWRGLACEPAATGARGGASPLFAAVFAGAAAGGALVAIDSRSTRQSPLPGRRGPAHRASPPLSQRAMPEVIRAHTTVHWWPQTASTCVDPPDLIGDRTSGPHWPDQKTDTSSRGRAGLEAHVFPYVRGRGAHRSSSISSRQHSLRRRRAS
jgi:hypothetical protein